MCARCAEMSTRTARSNALRCGLRFRATVCVGHVHRLSFPSHKCVETYKFDIKHPTTITWTSLSEDARGHSRPESEQLNLFLFIDKRD